MPLDHSLYGGSAWALVGAAAGTVITKLLDRWFAMRKAETRGHGDIELELHRELAKVREQTRVDLGQAEKDLDDWKQRYYLIVDENHRLRAKLRDCHCAEPDPQDRIS